MPCKLLYFQSGFALINRLSRHLEMKRALRAYLAEILEPKPGTNINHRRQTFISPIIFFNKFSGLAICPIVSKAKEIGHDTYQQRHYHALHICFPFQPRVYFPKKSAIDKPKTKSQMSVFLTCIYFPCNHFFSN